MFDKFKFRDAMLGLWKYKILIIIVAILTLVFTFTKNQNSGSKSQKKDKCLVTESFNVLPSLSSVDGDDLIAKVDTAEVISRNCLAQLNSDSCLEYVFKKVQEKVDAKDIVKKVCFDNDYTVNSLNRYFLNDLVKIECSEYSNSLINIYVLTDDDVISGEIMNAYKDFINSMILVKGVEGNFIGVTQRFTKVSLDNAKMGMEEESKEVNFSKVLLKQIIIWEFLMLAIAVIAIFTKVLFDPTMNSRYDFFQYEVPVLFEMNGFGGSCNV